MHNSSIRNSINLVFDLLKNKNYVLIFSNKDNDDNACMYIVHI